MSRTASDQGPVSAVEIHMPRDGDRGIEGVRQTGANSHDSTLAIEPVSRQRWRCSLAWQPRGSVRSFRQVRRYSRQGTRTSPAQLERHGTPYQYQLARLCVSSDSGVRYQVWPCWWVVHIVIAEELVQLISICP